MNISSNLLRTTAVACAFALGTFSSAEAATVLVETETGIAMESQNGLRADTGSRGVDMAGAIVTVTFDDGTTDTKIWQAFDPYTEGGVNGDRWSLYQTDSTRISIVADGRIITKMVIDSSTSNSVSRAGNPEVDVFEGAALFDISAADEGNGDTGSTPGSAFGYAFSFTDNEPNCANGGMECVIATYSGIVNLAGQPAQGDLFTTMMVDFAGLEGGGFTGASVSDTDMDVLAKANDLTPVMAPVPLPAALPLLVFGLGGLRLMRRRKSV